MRLLFLVVFGCLFGYAEKYCINIDDAVIPDVEDAYSSHYGWKATIDGKQNPVSKSDFTKQKIAYNVERFTYRVAVRKAKEETKQSKQQEMDAKLKDKITVSSADIVEPK